MIFTDPLFLFVFLPIVLITFYTISHFAGKNAALIVLFVSSIIFYIPHSWFSVALLIIALIVNFVIALAITFMDDEDKRRKELVKTTGTGKPSKGSIDWMRAQGMDVREFEAELAEIEHRLAPLADEAATIDAVLAPYEAIKEELKEARATLRRLKAAFVARLTAARAKLDDDDCRELVLDIDRERLDLAP